MKTNQTKQSCIDKFILTKWNYVIITVVFVIIEVVLFGWATNINLKSPTDYSLFGAFGDFIGGDESLSQRSC